MTEVVLLASYPRSGNTFLRTILFQCFGIRSASVYQGDLGHSTALQEIAGHVEHIDGKVPLYEGETNFVKTHRTAGSEGPNRAIYVVRNGIDALRSLHQFYGGKHSLEEIINGWQFGTWSDHLAVWNPKERPNTLLLRYEDMRSNTRTAVHRIAGFLQRLPHTTSLPPRAVLADGRWINKEQERSPLTPEQMDLFNSVNGEAMKQYGY